MTKGELIKKLEGRSDDTVLEIDLGQLGRPIWVDIVDVENADIETKHCLLTAGRVVAGQKRR